jgi:hypothetical protein
MPRLFGVLDTQKVIERARRAVPIYKGTVPGYGEVFDLLAQRIMDAKEEGREQVFLDAMRPYLQTETATSRWGRINALARAYGGDFQELVDYFKRHGLPAKTRAPER